MNRPRVENLGNKDNQSINQKLKVIFFKSHSNSYQNLIPSKNEDMLDYVETYSQFCLIVMVIPGGVRVLVMVSDNGSFGVIGSLIIWCLQ